MALAGIGMQVSFQQFKEARQNQSNRFSYLVYGTVTFQLNHAVLQYRNVRKDYWDSGLWISSGFVLYVIPALQAS